MDVNVVLDSPYSLVGDCPACGSAVLSGVPCAKCEEFERLFESKRLDDADSLRFLGKLPRTDEGIVGYVYGPPPPEPPSLFRAACLSLVLLGMWYALPSVVGFVLRRGW